MEEDPADSFHTAAIEELADYCDVAVADHLVGDCHMVASLRSVVEIATAEAVVSDHG